MIKITYRLKNIVTQHVNEIQILGLDKKPSTFAQAKYIKADTDLIEIDNVLELRQTHECEQPPVGSSNFLLKHTANSIYMVKAESFEIERSILKYVQDGKETLLGEVTLMSVCIVDF